MKTLVSLRIPSKTFDDLYAISLFRKCTMTKLISEAIEKEMQTPLMQKAIKQSRKASKTNGK